MGMGQGPAVAYRLWKRTLRAISSSWVGNDLLVKEQHSHAALRHPSTTRFRLPVGMAASVLLADTVYDVPCNVILDSAMRAVAAWDVVTSMIKCWVFGTIIATGGWCSLLPCVPALLRAAYQCIAFTAFVQCHTEPLTPCPSTRAGRPSASCARGCTSTGLLRASSSHLPPPHCGPSNSQCPVRGATRPPAEPRVWASQPPVLLSSHW